MVPADGVVYVPPQEAVVNSTAAPVAKVAPVTTILLVPAAGPIVWLSVAAVAKLGAAVPTTIPPATASTVTARAVRWAALDFLICIRWFSSVYTPGREPAAPACRKVAANGCKTSRIRVCDIAVITDLIMQRPRPVLARPVGAWRNRYPQPSSTM